jgi:hypothetical protein
MLAHDTPERYIKGYGSAMSLPEYLDCNRSGKGWEEPVTAWHVTTNDKVESILKNGLRQSSCSNWMSSCNDRPSAVYMFCARSVVDLNIPRLLDSPTDAVILKVTIPAKYTGNLYIDNIYNMSTEDAMMSSIQYRDNVPANWIEVSK